MENRDYAAVVGSPDAPFINELAGRYALATNYFAVTHPSQPNYIALFSGSTQGVTDDGVHDLGGRNLADQLDARGRTWRVFAENVPAGCYTGAVAVGGLDGDGTYARKHDPAISFTDIAGDPSRCGRISDFSHFDPSAADFELIVPNLCHDGHDCSTATADAFLRSFIPRITGSPAFAGSALFIVWDEGTSAEGGGGRVPALVASPLVKSGSRSDARFSHYSLLRTIEDAWGLGCLGASCAAADMGAMFAAQ